MKLTPQCIRCQINKQEQKIRSFEDADRKLEYMQKVCQRIGAATSDDCAPSLSIEFQELFSTFWNIPRQDFSKINSEFNQLLMELTPSLRRQITESEDPLAKALLLSRIGNYIDYSTVPDVNQETAVALLEQRSDEILDPREYSCLKQDLAAANSLVYLTDNCGEIVLDQLVIEVLKKEFPSLSITVVVRGYPAANDATLTDAAQIGLTDLVPVVGNGSNVGGTWMPGINSETTELLKQADLIIAKGQGNYETLHGCGLNIYYLFLCKCEYFVSAFHAKPLDGMFVNETRIFS